MHEQVLQAARDNMPPDTLIHNLEDKLEDQRKAKLSPAGDRERG